MRSQSRLLLAAGVALVWALAGCSDGAGAGVATAGGAAPAGASASASPTSAADQGRRFAECMRENGVDVPDPDPTSGKVQFGDLKRGDKQDVGEAMEKCHQYLPMGREPSRQLSPEDVEKQRKFAECMREHGVDVPDPDPQGRIRITIDREGRRIDRSDEQFREAFHACRALSPRVKLGLDGGK